MNTDPQHRPKSADATREAILEAAIDEFSELGFAGARVESIARQAKIAKSMLFYHFKDKDRLYRAVFEKVYPAIRAAEEMLDIDPTKTVEAITRVIEFTFHYHAEHEAFVRLVMNENIHRAMHVRASHLMHTMNARVFDRLNDIIKHGQDAGLIGTHVTAIDLHLLISSFCFYRVSNKHTIGVVHDIDLAAESTRVVHLAMVKRAVFGFITPHSGEALL